MRVVRLLLMLITIVAATAALAGPGPCKDCVTAPDGQDNCNLVTGDSWGCINTAEGCDIVWLYCAPYSASPSTLKVASVEIVHDRILRPSTEQLASAERPSKNSPTLPVAK